MDFFPPFRYMNDRNEFEAKQALVFMLEYLIKIFNDISEYSDLYLRWHFPYEILSSANVLAVRQAEDLIARLKEINFDSEQYPIDDYGLRGEALRFKMEVIAQSSQQFAIQRNYVLERVIDGDKRKGVKFWRKTLKHTLAAIDGPLESLTKMLGVKEGVVEFKKGLEVLLDMAS